MHTLGYMHGQCDYETVAVGSGVSSHTLFQKSCPVTCWRGGKIVYIANTRPEMADNPTKQ